MRSDPACSRMVRVGHFDACVEYPERTGARRTNYMREEARWGETVAFEAGMEYERQPKVRWPGIDLAHPDRGSGR